MTGRFVDSPVSNLAYRTESQSGRTNSDGEFQYIVGETIVFSVGSLEFPSARAGGLVTPQSLANVQVESIGNTVVTNIARLLQSLDSDTDRTTIEIREDAHSSTLVVTESGSLDFFEAPDFDDKVAGLEPNLISADKAQEHLRESFELPANQLPIADAGDNQVGIDVGEAVVLDAADSDDPDGSNANLTYQWSLESPEGSSAELNDDTASSASFTPDVAGTYTASLVVNDGQDNSEAVTITIQVEAVNQIPVADAGSAQSVTLGDTVTLDGTGSSDPDGDNANLIYQWSLETPEGATAELVNESMPQASFIPNALGIYTASLVVNDGQDSSPPDSVTVQVNDPGASNAPPIAAAGSDQSLYLGDPVTLDATDSSDADGDTLTYQWSLETPEGSNAVLSNATASQASFTPDVVGTYIATLIVNDGVVDSATDSVNIQVEVLPTVYNVTLDFSSTTTSSDASLTGGVTTNVEGTGTIDTETGIVTSTGTEITSNQTFFGNPTVGDISLDIYIDSAAETGTQTRTSCVDVQATLTCSGPSSPSLNEALPLDGLTGNNWEGGETTGDILTYGIDSTQPNPITGGDIYNQGTLTVTLGQPVTE